MTDDIEDNVFDTGTSEYNIYFDIQGTKPISFVGRGTVNFYGDNRGYKSTYPTVNFKEENSVLPGYGVYRDVHFDEGTIIPAGATIVCQNPQNLSNVTVKGKLVI